MSSINLEGLEIKEATPSIAPSIYESEQYTKWKIVLAIGIGVCLIGLSMLIFYMSAEGRRSGHHNDIALLMDNVKRNAWRKTKNGECFAFSRPACPQDFGEKSLLFIVFSGLRIDQMTEIPALSELIRCGVKADSLVPSYPSFTHPNLFSLATGLYSESHGIITNLNETNSVNGSSTLLKSFLGPQVQPVWEILRKNDVISASYNWPGAETDLWNNDTTPEYKEKIPFLIQVNKVLDWLRLPKTRRPRLIMMHYEEPGQTAMNFGPFSPETTQELVNINAGLDEIMMALDQMNIFNCLDLMVVSDHGVAASLCENAVSIDHLLSEELPGQLHSGTVGRINFDDDTDINVVKRITHSLQCKESALKVLTKDQVPKRYHYTHNVNIGELLLDTKSGYRITTEDEDQCSVGQFGYDPLSRSMQGAFVSFGPSFKIGYETASFRNVEIFNLILHILKINPVPNNGTVDSLLNLLKRPYKLRQSFKNTETKFLNIVEKDVPQREDNAMIRKESDKVRECSCEVKKANGRKINTEAEKISEPKSPTKIQPSLKSVNVVTSSVLNKSQMTNTFKTSENPPPSTKISLTIETMSTEQFNLSSNLKRSPENSTTGAMTSVQQLTSRTQIVSSTTSATIISTKEQVTEKILTEIPTSSIMKSQQSEILIVNSTIRNDNQTLKLSENSQSTISTFKTNEPSVLRTVSATETEPEIVPASVYKTTEILTSSSPNISSIFESPDTSSDIPLDSSTAFTADKTSVTLVKSLTNPVFKSITVPSVTVMNNVKFFTEDSIANSSPTSNIISTLKNSNTIIVPDSTTKYNSSTLPTEKHVYNNSNEGSTSSHIDISTPISLPPQNSHENKEKGIEILPLPAGLKSMSLVKKEDEITLSNSELKNLHTPWGIPRFSAPEVFSDTLNVLLHSSHIVGFPESLGMAVWTSFTMTSDKLKEIRKHRPTIPTGLFVTPEEKKADKPTGCWIADSRLQRSSSDQCSRSFQSNLYESQNVSLRQLFPEELEIPSILSKEGFLLTNLAPMRKGFETGPRKIFQKAIESWTENWQAVNVLHGPVFDYNYDGQRDNIITIRNTIKPLIPSDYFYVVTVCNQLDKLSEQEEDANELKNFLSLCPFSNLKVYSFVLPNTDDNDMCFMSEHEYLQYHLASLADVEQLTSLKTFSLLPTSEQVQLRARQPLVILPF